METLEILRRRIETTESLQSIVRTMKSLAAVSIRLYEQAAASVHEYTDTVELGLQIALQSQPPDTRSTEEKGDRFGFIVFGSDHGLCGRFNDVIADFAVRQWQDRSGRDRGVVLVLGAQSASRLSTMGITADSTLSLPGAIEGLSSTCREILIRIEKWRATRDVRRVFLLHNRRTADATAAPQATRLIPVDPRFLTRLSGRTWPSRSLPAFTMAREELLSSLLRQYFFISVFRAGVESLASEHATRLASMQAAERNIDERLEEMHGDYRRRRQQAITEELLDVVAGAEALRQERP